MIKLKSREMVNFSLMSKTVDLKCVIWKEGDDYVAQCLEVDVSSFGKSRKKALVNLQDALELYFEDSSFPEKTVKYPVITTVRVKNA